MVAVCIITSYTSVINNRPISSDYMARIFADKLDKILEESEKQDFNNRNAEDIFEKFQSSKDAA